MFPTRSHTVAAQGGVSASLGNMSEDNWYWHMYDTVKGSDWLGDQDAIEFMCREAPNAVYELEHFGMPFDRNPDGTIYQRPFGGHTANFGEAGPARLCRRRPHRPRAAAPSTSATSPRTQFFVEWMALDLLRNEAGDVVGVTALEMETGEIYILEAKTTVLATGAPAASGPLPPTPSSTPVTAWAWPPARASRCRTWNSGSSTRPAWPAPAC